jgi:hypothetical protein
MNKIIILLIFLSGFIFAQNKYLIYFNDKGLPEEKLLSKTSSEFSEAMEGLSERSIERRKKSMGDEFITFEDLPLNQNYIQRLTESGVKIVHQLKWFNAVSAYLNDEQLNMLKKNSFVKNIERIKVFKRKELEKSSKPGNNFLAKTEIIYGQSFEQLSMSQIPKVHRLGITGGGVLIGLLDTGFRWKTHESLRDAAVVAERDFIFNDNNTANESEDHPSQDSHGTTVFSIIGGFKDSVLIGSSFGSSFLLAKTEDVQSETHIEEDNYAAALEWMENLGVDITSSSVGYNEFDTGLNYTYNDMDGKTTIVTKAAELAFSRGVVTLTSAGNEGIASWRYITAPADGFNTIAVGAVGTNGAASGFSSRGPTVDGRIKPDISAMGVTVFGAAASGGYYSNNGTSVAAPIASGVAGLLLSAFPHLTNVQVRDILLRTASIFNNPNNSIGYGIIDAFSAVNYPNIEVKNGNEIIHKLFYDDDGVNSSTVKIHYTINNKDFTEETMNSGLNSKYFYEMPTAAAGQKRLFYFTLTDSTGNTVREPLNKNYSYKSGRFIVEEDDGKAIPEGFVLGQNYPNPFNNKTRINFYAAANEHAEMIIIDGSGQRVAVIFNGITNIGENTVEWNGYADNGWQCASGVYYYILKLGGKEYGQKMILLK